MSPEFVPAKSWPSLKIVLAETFPPPESLPQAGILTAPTSPAEQGIPPHGNRLGVEKTTLSFAQSTSPDRPPKDTESHHLGGPLVLVFMAAVLMLRQGRSRHDNLPTAGL